MQKLRKFLFKNTHARQILIKNTIWIGVSTTLIKVLRAGIIIYAARLLGTEQYGVFTYATGLVAIFAVFSDMGLSSILVREISKNEDEVKKYFSTGLAIKFGFLSAMSILIFCITPYISKFQDSTNIIPVVALSVIFESLRTFFYSIARAQSKLQKEAILSIVNEVFCIFLIIVLFIRNPTSQSLAYSYMAGNALGLISTLYFTRKYLFDSIKYFSKKLITPLIKLTLPFAILGVFGIFMTNIDTVIIGYFGNENMLGLFGAAQRPISILYIIPGFLSISILPVVSKMIKENQTERTTSLINIASRGSLMIALPLTIGGILVASPLMTNIFGVSYIGAISTFQILLATLLFVFPGTIFAEILIAQNKQKVFLITGISGALINIGLDLILIPKYGIAGSAIATLCAQAVVNIFFYLKVKQSLNITLTNTLYKSVLGTFIMGAFAYVSIQIELPLFAILSLSAFIYTGILFVLKDKTLIEIRQSFK